MLLETGASTVESAFAFPAPWHVLKATTYHLPQATDKTPLAQLLLDPQPFAVW
jgi:hypothetical protein